MNTDVPHYAPPAYLGNATNEEVVGRAEICEHWDISVNTFDGWRKHPLSPKPRGRINNRNPWWLLSDWDVFLAARNVTHTSKTPAKVHQ